MEKAEWQLEAQDEASPCKTCDDLQEEVGQLRKEISELRKALQCLQTSEREDAGGTRKKKRRKRTKGEQPLAPSRPEKGAELEITNSDLELAEVMNFIPEELLTYKIIKANDAAKEKKEATDAEAKEMPPTSVEGEEEDESKDQSDDESEEETEDEDGEGGTTPPTSEEEPPPPPPWRMGSITEQRCRCDGKGKGKKGKSPAKGKPKGGKGKEKRWTQTAEQQIEQDHSSFHSCGTAASSWRTNWNGGPR